MSCLEAQAVQMQAHLHVNCCTPLRPISNPTLLHIWLTAWVHGIQGITVCLAVNNYWPWFCTFKA